MIQSSRPGYYPHGKNEWIAAVKKVYKRDGKMFAKYLQDYARYVMNHHGNLSLAHNVDSDLGARHTSLPD